jgi:predicted DNA-binding protein
METSNQPKGEIYFLLVPLETYKLLSDIAARKNKTLAQVLQAAVERYLKEEL